MLKLVHCCDFSELRGVCMLFASQAILGLHTSLLTVFLCHNPTGDYLLIQSFSAFLKYGVILGTSFSFLEHKHKRKNSISRNYSPKELLLYRWSSTMNPILQKGTKSLY